MSYQRTILLPCSAYEMYDQRVNNVQKYNNGNDGVIKIGIIWNPKPTLIRQPGHDQSQKHQPDKDNTRFIGALPLEVFEFEIEKRKWCYEQNTTHNCEYNVKPGIP